MTTPDSPDTAQHIVDAPIHQTAPRQIPPQLAHLINDAYAKSHEHADTDSGDGAIHHTLGKPGGGATFEHQHGVFNSAILPLKDYYDNSTVDIGSGGLSAIFWQTISDHLIWVAMGVLFGSSGTPINLGGHKQWYYEWTTDFLFHNKISPKQSLAFLDTFYYSNLGSMIMGKLAYIRMAGLPDRWIWYWPDSQNNPPLPILTTQAPFGTAYSPISSCEPGDLMVAQGIYQYA